MKRILILGTILSFILSTVVAGYSFHCGKFGKNLARKGMHKHQILKDCGPPFSKEIVGFDESTISTRIVEEWVYIIKEFGQENMSLIKFDGNGIAIEVDWLGEK